MEPEILLTDDPLPADREPIADGLTALITAKIGRWDGRPLAVLLKDPADGIVIGGLWGRTSLDWLYVELLYVPDALRESGVGTELMRRAEAEARERGCHGAYLNTLSFQARGFYEKLGYSLFGQLDDSPKGYQRFFMQKRLD